MVRGRYLHREDIWAEFSCLNKSGITALGLTPIFESFSPWYPERRSRIKNLTWRDGGYSAALMDPPPCRRIVCKDIRLPNAPQ
jgi:hypothetical protein